MMDFKKFFQFDADNDQLLLYRLFLNEDTGDYEIVSRSGDVVCIVPHVSGFSDQEHLHLARTILSDFQDGMMNEVDSGLPFLDRLLCSGEVSRLLDSLDYDLPWFDYRDIPLVAYRENKFLKVSGE